MQTARAVHIAMEVWGIIFMMLAYFTEWLGRKTDKEKGIRVRGLLGICSILLLSDLLAWTFRGDTTSLGIAMTRITNAIVFLTYVLIEDIMVSYLLITSGVKTRWAKACKRITLILFFSLLIMLIINQHAPFLYAFDATNHYYRLPLFPIVFAPAFLGLITVLCVTVRCYMKMDQTSRIALLVAYFMIVISGAVQLLVYGISFSVLGFSVAVLVLSLIHQAEKSNELLRAENELKDLQMQQLRAQMQPHFIFNSLTTIRSLIKRDPNEAYIAVSDFSRYLRGSLNSLQNEKNWSLGEEMQMVEGYLSLEKRRFGDQLQIEIKTEDNAFLVPQLSIQTLVENAVRHGLRGKTDGQGHLLVETKLENGYHFVYIIDDGIGFDVDNPYKEDGRVHTGLANTKRRIEDNEGEMKIESKIGEGTRITLKFKADKIV